jgi:hypothetical protein
MLLVRKIWYNRERRKYELKTLRATSWQEICRSKTLFIEGKKHLIYQTTYGSQIVISNLKRGFSKTQLILKNCDRVSPLPDPDPYGPRLRDTYSRLTHLANATLAGRHRHLSLLLKDYKDTFHIVYNLNNLTITYVEPFNFDTFVPKKFLGALRDLPTSRMDL